MRTAPVVALLTLAVAAPSAAARPAISVGPSDLEPATPVTVALKAPGGFAAAANRIRFTIRQQRHDASCVSVASVTVRPNRRRTGARATVRLGAGRRWCSGEGQAEARVLDRRGAVVGSAIVSVLTIAPAEDETIAVKVTVLDGSTINGSAVAGALAGSIPAKIALNANTTVSGLTGMLSGCSVTQSQLILLADGVVFGSVHTGCAGSILLAGRAGDGGLSKLVMDSFSGSLVAHLVLNVDLSS
jgi:hypothetical protein